MARVQETSSSGSSIDLVGCESRQKTSEAVWQCEGIRLTYVLQSLAMRRLSLQPYTTISVREVFKI